MCHLLERQGRDGSILQIPELSETKTQTVEGFLGIPVCFQTPHIFN